MHRRMIRVWRLRPFLFHKGCSSSTTKTIQPPINNLPSTRQNTVNFSEQESISSTCTRRFSRYLQGYGYQSHKPNLNTFINFNMFVSNPSCIMRNMIAFLVILPLAISTANGTPIAETERSIEVPRFKVKICSLAPAGVCTLTIQTTLSRIQDGLDDDMVWVFDNECNTIGGGMTPFKFDLASQLKYKIDGLKAHDNNFNANNPEFCYAGACYGWHDKCWSKADAATGQWVNSCQFTCSQP